jgi:4-hydroxy-tetrahydrodipicolinate synthase
LRKTEIEKIKFMPNKFQGTAVPLITAFNDDMSVDYQSIVNLVDYYLSNGIDYLVVHGTTSESPTTTIEEKFKIIDLVIEKNAGRVPLVAGFGGNDTLEIIHNINKRNFKGIDAILSVTPYYNKPNQRGLIEHYKAIADVSPVPVILYNVPSRTNVNINAETALKLAEHPNIIGIKEASGSLPQIMQIIKNKPEDFFVVSGDDILTYSMITAGAIGVISVVALAKPREMSDIVRFALDGNYSKSLELHYQLMDFMNAIFEDGNPAGVKAAMHLQNKIKYNMRLPLVGVNEKTFEKIRSLV